MNTLFYKENGKVNWITPIPAYNAKDFEATLEVDNIPVLDEGKCWDIADGKLIQVDISQEHLLSSAIEKKLSEITAYDNSIAVNSFTLNGIDMWFDNATRLSYTNSLQSLKAVGETKTDLVLPDINVSIAIDIDTCLGLIAQLSAYSSKCAIVTKTHILNVKKLTTLTDVKDYDFKKGYPDKLDFKL